MSRELFRIPVWRLDEFIKNHLIPDTAFLADFRADVDFISAFLMDRCFQGATHPVRVSRVVMGGSYDEHTALKGRSEANMVVFLNNLTSFEEQLKRRGEFIEEIQEHLCQLQQEEQFREKFEVRRSEQPNARSLSFKLSYPEFQQEVEFDVQPAHDVLYELRNLQHFDPSNYSKIYAQLIHECTTLEKEGEFSICFTDLHQSFLTQRAPKLWNLIRLTKHWYQLCEEKLRQPLPPRYALELLTIYAWECGVISTMELHTAQCFRTVLELITKYGYLRVYWTWCYDFKHEFRDYLYGQLQKHSPLILDPADPTRNVAGSDLLAWELLAREAQYWLKSTFFRAADLSFVNAWQVSPEKQECVFL
ncbi:inactive 2'-5'-oligoadenylate synthase 1D-like [Apodemus sylvaticus]|uniref:inactive 2'-5'-oligoadenylate synthase 1D-like n=1 Tax=Apodemus sylvaticus TaxID=10129 RepID=UPI002244A9B4|nr:inactive 2'-5'-oligoadenylate synthase 1D-like [Apodemus sylvaticus]